MTPAQDHLRLPRAWRARRWHAVLAVVLAACGASSDQTAPPSTVAALTLRFDRDSLLVGEMVRVFADARSAGGQIVENPNLTFQSSAPSVATVTAGGAVTAVSAGTAVITATAGSVSAAATVRVFEVPIAAIVLSHESIRMRPGNAVQLVATPLDASLRPVRSRTVAWLSSDTTKVIVSSTGLVAAVAPGITQVHAIAGAVYVSLNVRVTGLPGPVASVDVNPSTATLAPGASLTFAATLEDAEGNLIEDRRPTWMIGDTTVARVTTNGIVTAIAEGRTTLTAIAEGITGSASLTVSAAASRIVLRAARPDPADVVGDTMDIFISVSSANPIVHATALADIYGTTLEVIRTGSQGTGPPALVGTIDMSSVKYGTHQLLVTARDSEGNETRASFPYIRGARKGKGGTSLPPRSK